MHKKIYLFSVLLLLQSGHTLAAGNPSLRINGAAPIPGGRYENIAVDSLKLTQYTIAPELPCDPGDLYNYNGLIYICDDLGQWSTLTGYWGQNTSTPTPYLYMLDPTLNLGIGTVIPQTAKLTVYETAGTHTAVDIVEGSGSPASHWTLRAYESLPVNSGNLAGAFVIDNLNPGPFGTGSFVITQAGRVNIAQNIANLPVGVATMGPMLNVQSNRDAMVSASGNTPATINGQNLAATFSNNASPSSIGTGVGIGFGIDATAPNVIHGAIAVERVASDAGRLHLGASSDNTGNIPIALTITENTRVSIGDSSPSADAHLTITRKFGDPLSAAVINFVDLENSGEIGRLNFQRGANFTSLLVDASGDFYIYKDETTKRAKITQDLNNNGAIEVFKADGTTSDGFLMASPDNTRTLRGKVNAAGSVDAVNGSGGFTAVKMGTGRYRVTFNSAFADIPVVMVSAIGAPAFGVVSNQSLTQFDVGFFDTGNFLTDISFNFIVEGKR